MVPCSFQAHAAHRRRCRAPRPPSNCPAASPCSTSTIELLDVQGLGGVAVLHVVGSSTLPSICSTSRASSASSTDCSQHDLLRARTTRSSHPSTRKNFLQNTPPRAAVNPRPSTRSSTTRSRAPRQVDKETRRCTMRCGRRWEAQDLLHRIYDLNQRPLHARDCCKPHVSSPRREVPATMIHPQCK